MCGLELAMFSIAAASTVASFVNIAGVDVALSLIVSALIARQGLMSVKVFIAKV